MKINNLRYLHEERINLILYSVSLPPKFCLLLKLGGRMVNQPAKSFQDLIVWRKAHEFVLLIYPFSQSFPKSETYGLISQLRRASVSVPANIAEGFRRKTLPDKLRFLNIAQSSLEECRYYLILAQDLNYGDSTQLMQQLEEVSKLLNSYSQKIEQRNRGEGRKEGRR